MFPDAPALPNLDALRQLQASDGLLSTQQLTDLQTHQQQLATYIDQLYLYRLHVGQTVHYQTLRQQGYTQQDVQLYMEQDESALDNGLAFDTKRDHHRKLFYGYQRNMRPDTALTAYFKQEECKDPFHNDGGDPYEVGSSRLNYKVYEQRILDVYYDKFGIDKPCQVAGVWQGGWGYLANGGTEGNAWGIRNGMSKFDHATVYYCESAHFSLAYAVGAATKHPFPHVVIPVAHDDTDQMDVDALKHKVLYNWQEHGRHPVIVCVWGSTKFGSCDDVQAIYNWLQQAGIPGYIHLDAAHYGGIPMNQVDAPTVPHVQFDSISLSLHKYVGANQVKSVVLARVRPQGEFIPYLSQTVRTASSSRTIQGKSLLQRVIENEHRTHPKEYTRTIQAFESLLKQHHIPYTRDSNGNTFVVARPSKETCQMYQLCTFMSKNGRPLAHIIIYPYHITDQLHTTQQLVEDLARDLTR